MFFLTLLLEDVLETISKQIDNFQKHGEKIKKHPFELILPKLIVTEHLERIKKSTDSPDSFQGFTLILGHEDETIRKYKDFLGHLDFLHERLKQLLSSNEKHVKSSIELRINFKNIADKFYSLLPKLISVDNSMYEKYLLIFNTMLEEKPLNIERFYNEFCVSMFEEIKEKAPSEIVQYFIYELRLMTTLLDELKFSNLYFVQSEIDILDKELQPQIRKIYELSAEIKSKLIK